MSGMKIALQEAKVRKELNVLLNSDESMLNLFSTVFSDAITKCCPSQKEIVCSPFFSVTVLMSMQVFYSKLYSGISG